MATDATPDEAAANITVRIAELDDWRGTVLAQVRRLIHDADPDVVEAWKWRGTPVWEHDGIVCTGESYKKVVKLTFMRGASVPDPTGLFNASLEGGTRRAIDIDESMVLDEDAFIALVRAAIAVNAAARSGRATKARTPSTG